ncbi:MAG: hypothetical protein IJA67_12795 [Oscillospiraceae bacterium]|nr:hypothetical protein [Oscillospiraceae bacterium]
MKRLTITILALLMLTSCNNTLHNPDRTDTPANFTYTYEPSDDIWLDNQPSSAKVSGLAGHGNFLYLNIDSSPMRLNTTSGKFSYLCSDPLCFHNTHECPFYTNTFTQFYPMINENSIIFPVQYSEPIYRNGTITSEKRVINELRQYDISTGKLDVLIEDFSHGGIIEMAVGGDYIYHYTQKKDEDNSVTYYISQYNMTKGTETEEWLIAAMDGLNPYNLVYADDDSLYLNSYVEGTIYNVSHDDPSALRAVYEAPEGYVTADVVYSDGVLMFQEKTADGTSSCLMRCNAETGDTDILLEFNSPLRYMYYTENYVYYVYDRYMELPISTGGSARLPETVIYRLGYTADLLTEEKVFAFSDEMSTYSMQYFVVSGNYLYGYYITWGEPKEVYEQEDGYDSKTDGILMRIHLNNGEIDYIKE